MVDWGRYPLILELKHIREILGIGRNTSYEIFHREDFPGFRVGRSLRVSREAFVRWIEQQEGIL